MSNITNPNLPNSGINTNQIAISPHVSVNDHVIGQNSAINSPQTIDPIVDNEMAMNETTNGGNPAQVQAERGTESFDLSLSSGESVKTILLRVNATADSHARNIQQLINTNAQVSINALGAVNAGQSPNMAKIPNASGQINLPHNAIDVTRNVSAISATSTPDLLKTPNTALIQQAGNTGSQNKRKPKKQVAFNLDIGVNHSNSILENTENEQNFLRRVNQTWSMSPRQSLAQANFR